MANTFKAKTKLNVSGSSGSPSTIYSVPSATTAVVLGLVVSNTTASTSITATVKMENNDGDNITIVKNAPVPAGGSLELMGGNKIVMEANDILKVFSSAASSSDCLLSIMEIT
tara:strand:- start:222 stop:560 length:339 start_codon:yes stop_codon:yes gene_type:complete